MNGAQVLAKFQLISTGVFQSLGIAARQLSLKLG